MDSTLSTTLKDLQRQAIPLLTALWPHDDYCYFICTQDQETKKFNNHPIASIEGAVSQAFSHARKGLDVFYSCAAYKTHQNRTRENAVGAFAFWLDIDCGKCKYESGNGYATKADAQQSLTDFCLITGLPEPTHIVRSGNGLHVYWALSDMLPVALWQKSAKKLKQLCCHLGFHADPSRTADIASVLRVPGTFNCKYSPHRPVTQLSASPKRIEPSIMLAAFDRASKEHCTTANPLSANTEIPANPREKSGHNDLELLASALLMLDPDCSETTWKLRRIAPLANESRRHPELTDELYKLSRSWSSGELRGIPSNAWKTPGGNGLSGEQVFDSTWERFLHSNYQGRLVGIGTIYFDAKQSGWVPSVMDGFTVIEKAGGNK